MPLQENGHLSANYLLYVYCQERQIVHKMYINNVLFIWRPEDLFSGVSVCNCMSVKQDVAENDIVAYRAFLW